MKLSISCIAILFLPELVLAQSNDLANRFRDEAPGKWTELIERTKGLCGTFTKMEYVMKEGKKTLKEKLMYEWKTIGDYGFDHYHAFNGENEIPHSEGASGANPLYLYTATYKGKKSGWLSDDIVLNPPSGHDAAIGEPIRRPRTVYRAGLNMLIANEYLDLIVADKQYRFQITGNGTLRPDNTNLVVVPCRYRSPTKKGQSFVNYISGKVTLDSSRYWVIVEYDVDLTTQPLSPAGIEGNVTADTARQIVTFKYRDVDGTPAPVSRNETHTYIEAGKPPVVIETIKQFQIQKVGSLDEAEFRMSRFGLPEPLGVSPPKKNHLFIWIILGAFALFAIAYLAVRQKKKLELKSQSKPI